VRRAVPGPDNTGVGTSDAPAIEPAEVWIGRYGDPVPLFGPLPGVRAGPVLAYEFALPDSFEPRPGGSLLQRTFALLDLGVSMGIPCWRQMRAPDGTIIRSQNYDSGLAPSWYVDLVHVTSEGSSVILRDLYLDVMVPVDGRHQRMLDLEEFADAIGDGTVPVPVALDGLRRWQAFLDRCLHHGRDPRSGWTDFPPAAIAGLAAWPAPLGPIVTAPA
jgi:Protein of unknown function (DUF402)